MESLEKPKAETSQRIISLTSSANLDNDALSKPLGTSRERGGGKDGGGKVSRALDSGRRDRDSEKVCFAFQKNGHCTKGDSCSFAHVAPKRTNRLLQAAIDQGISSRTGKRGAHDRSGNYDNKRARSGSTNNVDMNQMAKMQGFNSAENMMAMYQQNMMTMMQSVLAPVMEATANLVGGRGGRGGRGPFGRGGRGSFGRGGRGSWTSVQGEYKAPGADDAVESGGKDVGTNGPVQDGFVGDGTFDSTLTGGAGSAGHFGGRGRGRGRGRGEFFRGGRGGRGRGRESSGPVHKVWRREADVESSLPATR